MHNNTTSRPGAQGLPKAGSSASLPELHKKSVLSKASLRSFWSKLFFCAIWPGRAGLCVLCWCVLSLPRASLPASCWGRLASGRGVASRRGRWCWPAVWWVLRRAVRALWSLGLVAWGCCGPGCRAAPLCGLRPALAALAPAA